MPGFYDVKKWQQYKSFHNIFHLNVTYNLYNATEKQTETFKGEKYKIEHVK